jgi:hypothetical protein
MPVLHELGGVIGRLRTRGLVCTEVLVEVGHPIRARPRQIPRRTQHRDSGTGEPTSPWGESPARPAKAEQG